MKPGFPSTSGETRGILLLGGSGQVGTALCRLKWPAGFTVHAPSHNSLSITDEDAIDRVFREGKWACVINCAAYTEVEAAESGEPAVSRVNTTGPGLLAAAAARGDTPFIHLSTDYVFDGTATEPYRSFDPVHPLNAYGASKAAGEDLVRRANPRHVILRTSWVVSPFRKNFVKTVLNLAQRLDHLEVVDDQTSRLTSATDLAETLQVIALRLIEDPQCPVGTYHFANEGPATWHAVAVATMQGAARRNARSVPVEPISTRSRPSSALRPPYSVLCTASLSRDFGIAPRPWQSALEEVLDSLLPKAPNDTSPHSNDRRLGPLT